MFLKNLQTNVSYGGQKKGNSNIEGAAGISSKFLWQQLPVFSLSLD